MQQEKLEKQLTAVNEELKQDPDNPDLLNEKGILQHRMGQHRQAVQTFRKALHHHSDDHRIHFNLGNTFYEMQQVEQALNCYMDALDQKPDYVPALTHLADIYELAGEEGKATELFEYITQVNPDDPVGHFNLGNRYLRVGNGLEASRSYRKALELDPEFYEAFNNLGLLLKHIGKYRDAIEYYEKCLEINPDYEPAQKDLEYCKKQLANSSQA